MWRRLIAALSAAVIVGAGPGAAWAGPDTERAAGASVVSAAPTASGGGCSDWGPWAGGPLKACITYENGKIVGTGFVRNSPGAIMWIEICEHFGACQRAIMGDRVEATLPPGEYETVFYFGNGGGAQTSPVLIVP